MSEPLPPCPYTRRGRHNLCAVIPEENEHPVLLFCDRCGMTTRQSVALPAPLDDLSTEDIVRLTAR